MVTALVLLPLSVGQTAEPICATPGIIFCEDWEGTSPLPGQWADGYNDTLQSITTTAANVYQGTHALETLWPGGSAGAGVALTGVVQDEWSTDNPRDRL